MTVVWRLRPLSAGVRVIDRPRIHVTASDYRTLFGRAIVGWLFVKPIAEQTLRHLRAS